MKRWRSGETPTLKADSAAALERALATRGVFTRFVTPPATTGTRAALQEQLEAYEKRIARLERLIARRKGPA